MKISELNGALLALWVARAEGLETPEIADIGKAQVCQYVHHHETGDDGWWTDFKPHEDWVQGGPILEREEIELSNDRGWREDGEFGRVWQGNHAGFGYLDGDTPLVAAMRAFVASKYGDTVPDEAEK